MAGAAASDAKDLTASADDKVGNLTNFECKTQVIHRHKAGILQSQGSGIVNPCLFSFLPLFFTKFIFFQLLSITEFSV